MRVRTFVTQRETGEMEIPSLSVCVFVLLLCHQEAKFCMRVCAWRAFNVGGRARVRCRPLCAMRCLYDKHKAGLRGILIRGFATVVMETALSAGTSRSRWKKRLLEVTRRGEWRHFGPYNANYTLPPGSYNGLDEILLSPTMRGEQNDSGRNAFWRERETHILISWRGGE